MKTLLAAVTCLAFAGAAIAQPMSNFPAQPTQAEAAALAAQGAQPGDDAMTCEQIGTEMAPYAQAMMPHAAAMGETAKEIQAMGDRNRAAAMAQAPVNMGAAIAGSFCAMTAIS